MLVGSKFVYLCKSNSSGSPGTTLATRPKLVSSFSDWDDIDQSEEMTKG